MKSIALVTGASRGIGRAIAKKLARDGLCVVGTATSEQGAQAISARFKEQALDGYGLCLDVTNADQVNQVLKSIESLCGGLPTVLVNNAGITKDNLFLRMKTDEWNAVINTNLSAVYTLSKACIRHMTKQRFGRIINISSVVGSMGNAGQSNYAAAKAGLEGFSRALAAEVGSRSITVNSVAPGFIQTDMTDALPDEHKQTLLNKIPLGRLGSADEVAAAVSFLASDAAAYITGTTLHVNGGMYM